jgi:hypothetical protein
MMLIAHRVGMSSGAVAAASGLAEDSVLSMAFSMGARARTRK